VERSGHRAEPGDDLVLVDGCFLQHPEFHGTWDLVVFLRDGPPRPAGPYEEPDRPSGRAALAARHGRLLREDNLLAPDPLRRLLQRTGWRLARYDDGPDRFLAVAERVVPLPSR
jgi:hypothetical protein